MIWELTQRELRRTYRQYWVLLTTYVREDLSLFNMFSQYMVGMNNKTFKVVRGYLLHNQRCHSYHFTAKCSPHLDYHREVVHVYWYNLVRENDDWIMSWVYIWPGHQGFKGGSRNIIKTNLFCSHPKVRK
jgi:hypothetical protein